MAGTSSSSTHEPMPAPKGATKDAPEGVPGVDVSPEGVPYQPPSRPREETQAKGADYDYSRPSGGAGLTEAEPA